MSDVRCPICLTPVPVPLSDAPNAQGLSLGIDDTFVEEHIAMHRTCTCYWANGAITFIDSDCPVHAPMYQDTVEVGTDLFPDVLTTED